MTNKEYIQSKLARLGINENEVLILFAENPSLKPDQPLVLEDCERVLYVSFCSWIPMYESISEGDMTVKWNWNAIRIFLVNLSEKLGEVNPLAEVKPTATVISPWG